MKTLKAFLAVALVGLLLLSQVTNAQTVINSSVKDFGGKGMLVEMPNTAIATTSTYESKVFTLAGYDLDAGTAIKLVYGKLLSSASAKPKLTTLFKGSFDLSNWVTVDTVGAVADSTETWQTILGTPSSTYTFPYYKFTTTGTAANPSDTYHRIFIYAYKPDK